ncbi:putative toxin-antitoxin system toxin component, PIN family [Parapedobacter sp. DT-150]|uniref:putative toxin-antitoxin system toxin component, PIN family n=1 Tax=Parapedobacter sp. DT-150 TaxID=3396162 RepID=UPI003F1A6BF9
MARSHRKVLVIDTNWYISATINRASRRTLYDLLSNPIYTILCCDELIEEYKAVILRDKFKKYIRLQQAKRFIELIVPIFSFVKIKSDVRASRDRNDNYLLSLSKDGAADYLITGDPDLLVLKQYGQTMILTMKEFLEISQID